MPESSVKTEFTHWKWNWRTIN